MQSKVIEAFKIIVFILSAVIILYVIGTAEIKESLDNNFTNKPCSVIDPTCVYQLGKHKNEK